MSEGQNTKLRVLPPQTPISRTWPSFLVRCWLSAYKQHIVEIFFVTTSGVVVAALAASTLLSWRWHVDHFTTTAPTTPGGGAVCFQAAPVAVHIASLRNR
jgi:hypothetical protein